MQLTRKLALGAATLAVAFGAGHLMQNVLSKPDTRQAAVADPKPKAITPLAAGPDVSKPVTTAHITVLPPVSKPAPFPNVALQPAPAPVPVQPVAEAPAPKDCKPVLDLSVEPAAMLGLVLTAPCNPDERVVLRHAGLAVTGRTSMTGSLFLSLPAMEQAAQVSVLFGDGASVEGSIAVPELAGMQRFGVQWMAQDAFQVNAFEGGADYGQPGHVSAATPQRPAPGQPHSGGFLTQIGSDQVDLPMLAEVYTYPAKGEADIVVEAAVTKTTCGRELLGETLMSRAGQVTVTDLTLAMPDCSAVGDFLMLKNLVPDPKIAAAE